LDSFLAMIRTGPKFQLEAKSRTKRRRPAAAQRSRSEMRSAIGSQRRCSHIGTSRHATK
jgi:hypothetical protein